MLGQPTNRDTITEARSNGRTNGRGRALDERAGERVELRVPASSKYLRLARLTVAGFAGDLGFDVQSIEDLRVAVDELCAAVIDGVTQKDHLELWYSSPDGRVRVEGRVVGSSLPPPELHRVARELLDIVADGYDINAVEDGRVFWIEKGAGETP
jgi:serine/threonine-protein kinase RsbW